MSHLHPLRFALCILHCLVRLYAVRAGLFTVQQYQTLASCRGTAARQKEFAPGCSVVDEMTHEGMSLTATSSLLGLVGGVHLLDVLFGGSILLLKVCLPADLY